MAAIISFNIQALFMLLFGEVILLSSIVSLISLFVGAKANGSGYSESKKKMQLQHVTFWHIH